MHFVRDQLCFSGLSSKVQPLPSERAGPGFQQAAGFRSEAAVWTCGESKLSTGDSEVSHFKVKIQDFLLYSVKLWEENSNRLQDWTERDREGTVSQSDEPEPACCDRAFELKWRRLLLLCSCLQEVKLDHSWQHHRVCRDSGPCPSNCCSIKSLFSHFNIKQLISPSVSQFSGLRGPWRSKHSTKRSHQRLGFCPITNKNVIPLFP